MCSASGWTSEETNILIDLYRTYEVLYNIKSTDYHNKFARGNALEQIRKSLIIIKPNVTVPQIKSKINALRSRYTMELSKIKTTRSGQGVGETYQTSFEFFQKLIFLSDHVQARKGTLNIPLSVDIQIEKEPCSSHETWMDNVEVIDEEENEENVPPSSPSVVTQPPRKRKKSNSSTISEKFLESAGETLEKLLKQDNSSTSDEWQQFGTFVSTSIANLPNRKIQIILKHKIMKAIMEAEECVDLEN
ncbi:hypothetical protein FQR65_LT18396 [Abscondita terminalis]|nr:hypothetical protein FQR65_LT18396 [Abscondita terminalis]